MSGLGNLAIAILAGLLLGGGLGAWGGHELATGRAAKAELKDARQAVADAAGTLDAARKQLDNTTRTLAGAAARDAATASRHLQEAATYEQLIARAARAECERDPESFSVLVDAIGRANRYGADPHGGVAVPEALRPDAGPDRAR
ncbi:hypothetical protein E6C76_20175 [Pseudothauera nasutitermitis]|uniref:Uncharacterized protein n=1 Tax=Pseudothauera nasutitermitis TaxID=2565930 RepID=A0A4S4AQ69_9RHOO|nr:hypothetical protein [Pseudothauera nasutitermitis]THF61402.1 hypothetical protein E6C76_20175 [Pseudothauera nasutitermitis]